MKKLSASTEKATVKVSVVDDDDGIRASLATLIRRASSLKLLGEYSDAETALREIPARIPDVLLMDINLPGMNGVECVRQLKSALPQVQVLMLTVYEDNESLFDSLKAIHEVNTGGSPMTPQLARRVVQFFNGPPQNGEASSLARLTPGEREFIDLLAKGYAYKEIAEALKISIDTVRSYVRTVYEKLHVHSRTEAVVKYLRG
jgi:DNA-binding NarL/FixJ family response regulator